MFGRFQTSSYPFLGNNTLVNFTLRNHTMGDLTQVFTKIKFTLGNPIFLLGNYTLFKSIPGMPSKGNLNRVFISTKVIFTLCNLLLFLGNYTLVQFTPGNPTKGNLTPGINIYPV